MIWEETGEGSGTMRLTSFATTIRMVLAEQGEEIGKCWASHGGPFESSDPVSMAKC